MPEVIVTLSDTSITVTENVNTVTVYPERGITGNTGAKGDKGAKGDAGGAVAYLDDLIDVVITSVQNKDVIRYDTATGNWINTALLTDLTGVITSSNSVTTITSQTGTGTKFVVDTSPVLITPNLGTPSAGVLTNCTFPTLNQNTSGTAAGLSTTLIVGKGGTGLGTLTANNVILGAGTSAVTFVAPGTKGNVLTSDGTTWKSAASAGGSSYDQSLNTTDAVVFSKVTMTAALVEQEVTAGFSAGTLTIDLNTASVFIHNLTADITTIVINNGPASGKAIGFTLIFTADGTARSVAWGDFRWSNGVAPTLTITAGKSDVFAVFTYGGATGWYAYAAGQNQ